MPRVFKCECGACGATILVNPDDGEVLATTANSPSSGDDSGNVGDSTVPASDDAGEPAETGSNSATKDDEDNAWGW